MPVKKRSLVLSVLMLLVAANSIAMSLGRHRSATLIGRPLDISVFAVLDAQEDIASLCLDADVFYADNKLDKSRVRVTAEKTSANTQDVVVRVRSTVPVDEPVVTLYLRVGCQQKIERRYVTLADLVPEAVPDRSATSTAAQVIQVQVSPPTVTQPAVNSATTSIPATKPARKTRKSIEASNSSNAPAAAAPSQPTATATAEAVNPDKPKKRATEKKERAATVLATPQPSPPSRSRLKLEPLDLSIEREPQLKSSTELLSAPASSPQERAAAAAMWQAIAAQPQDILRDAEKLQALEKSVRGLQAQSQKTQQSIDELGAKLQTAQSERYANPLVYTLALLLLLALAGLIYVLLGQNSRRRLGGADTPWWRKNEAAQKQQIPQHAWADSGAHDDIFDSDLRAESKKRKTEIPAKAASSKSEPVIPELDLSFSSSELAQSKPTSNFGSDSVPPLASQYRNDFALSIPHASRAVKAEELFDVQQQADFFVSIGQHEQAIEVLRTHIGDGVETSALVYLDLFNLYHQLERKQDYAALREDFNRRFNTKIPAFEMYTDAGTGEGLEAYQMAMSRIESLWPSPKVLEIIEESIFRRPESNADAFNLEAYRELLMLYSVAKEIISPEPNAKTQKPKTRPKKFDLAKTSADVTDSRPMTFMSTSIQPLSANIDEAVAPHPDALMEPLPPSTVPPASLNLGLDLDLSEPMRTGARPSQIDVSNAEFFAQFDKDSGMSSPTLDVGSQAAKKPDSDNLIDFDAFDIATGATEKFKLPNN